MQPRIRESGYTVLKTATLFEYLFICIHMSIINRLSPVFVHRNMLIHIHTKPLYVSEFQILQGEKKCDYAVGETNSKQHSKHIKNGSSRGHCQEDTKKNHLTLMKTWDNSLFGKVSF